MKQLLFGLVFFSVAITNAAKIDSKVVEITVTEKGFEPSSVDIEPGVSLVLNVTRKTDATCATTIKVPSKKITKDLPLNKAVKIELGKLPKGEVKFLCGMDMLSGIVHVQ